MEISKSGKAKAKCPNCGKVCEVTSFRSESIYRVFRPIIAGGDEVVQNKTEEPWSGFCDKCFVHFQSTEIWDISWKIMK